MHFFQPPIFFPLKPPPPSPYSTLRHQKPLLAKLPNTPSPNPVAIIGATGGVGRLLTSRLLQSHHKVHALVRNTPRATQIFQSINLLPNPNLKLVEVSLTNDDDIRLREALSVVEKLVITVGTTAFPTRAWRGGNTPWEVDARCVERIVKAVVGNGGVVKKVVLASSIGSLRGGKFPFFVLNLFGVLDAKRFGEKCVIEGSGEGKEGYDWVVARLGRLVGGPYSNVGAWRIGGVGGKRVRMERGDVLSGDLFRGDAAEVLEVCLREDVGGVDFGVINLEGEELRDKGQILREVRRVVEESRSEVLTE